MSTLYFLLGNKEFTYQVYHNRRILRSDTLVIDSEEELLQCQLPEELSDLGKNISQVHCISAVSHYAMAPAGYEVHEAAAPMIAANAEFSPDKEEIMLSVRPKYQVQWYYSIPKMLYGEMKSRFPSVNFNFSGAQFLDKIHVGKSLEAHIHFLNDQCEFFIFKNKKIQLYNNLHSQNEVDFLYFVLFSLQKLNISITETRYFIYGAAQAHETFLSELKKIASHISMEENRPNGKLFIF